MRTAEARLKYASSDSAFFRTLRSRVHHYLSAEGQSRYGGPRMWLQSVGVLAVFATLYSLLILDAFSGVAVFFALVALHFVMFYATIGIAHDAAHGCYSSSARVNRALCLIFDALGVSSHYWVKNHVHSHHRAPNVPLHDSAIESFHVLRLSPKSPHYRVHSYQHIYVFAIYAVATIFQVYFLELVSFASRLTGFSTAERHPWPRLLGITVSKAFMLGYSVVIPVVCIDAPAALVLAGCVTGHLVCGLFIGVVFQTTHLSEGTAFPEPDADGVLPLPFAEHVLATTADFAPNSAFISWLCGGLNIHVAHHLFPRVSQIHLRAIARIVETTAVEHGLRYRRYTVWEGLRAHVCLMSELGRGSRVELSSRAP